MKISYIMQLVFQQMQRKKLSYIFLSILIFALSFLMVLLLLLINMFGDSYITLYKIKDHSIFLTNQSIEGLNEFISENNISDIIYEEISRISLYQKQDPSTGIATYLYGDIMADNMYLNLRKGKQLRNSEIEDGAYPIIVPESSKYAKYYNNEPFYLYYNDPQLETDGWMTKDTLKPIKVYVCGLLRYPYKIYETITMFPTSVNEFLKEPAETDFIIFKDIQLDNGMTLSESFKHRIGLTITKTTSNKEGDSLKLLKSTFSTLSVKDIIKLSYMDFANDVGDYIVLFFSAILLSVFYLVGINVFLQKTLINEYSLYYMCGARWSTCLLLEAIRNTVIISIPVLSGSLASVLFLIFDDPMTQYYVNFSMIFCPIIFIIMIFTISTLYFLIKLSKTKPIENIRIMVKD